MRIAWLAGTLALSLWVVPAMAGTSGGTEAPPASAVQAAPAPAAPAAQAVPAQDADVLPGVDDLLARKADDVAQDWAPAPPPAARQVYPWFEHHGYFRLRVDGFWRAHLGTDAQADGVTVNTSAFRPPLSANAKNDRRGEDWIAGANMRLRWAPVLHVAKGLSIRTEVDILDNIMLGSTPDSNPNNAGTPLSIFSRSQAAASAANSGKDPVTVKQAYVVWTPVEPKDEKGFLLQFSGGRMARNWGLGMVENAGQDLDADFGTYQDRVNVLTRIGGMYAELGYTWAATGPTTADPSQPYGEPHDLSSSDNVFDISLALFKRADSEAERQARFRRLVVQNKPVVDGGLYLTFRKQDLDVETQSYSTATTSAAKTAYDSVTLEKRDAWMLTPDLWLKLEWKPSLKENVRIELEAAGVFGHVASVPRFKYDKAQSLWIRDGQEELKVQSFGGTIQGEYVRGAISTGMNAGFATGTDAPWWGYADRSNVTTNKSLKTLSSFYFHPDYRVDQLLFRRCVGTVTNAWYVKPFIQYDLFEGEQDALAGRLEVLYARAFEKSATPGGDPNLGVEIDLKLFYEEKGSFFAGIDWGVLFPLKGFDMPANYGCADGKDCHDARSARWSMSIRGRFGVMF
jgi:uncharacterized protein (TIGR04551 family)